MKREYKSILAVIFVIAITHTACNDVQRADLILTNGKIVTVDQNFTIGQAVAVSGDKIIAVGTDKKIMRYTGDDTRIIDLKGKTVIPGIIESHLHPETASLSELEEEIPDVHRIDELLGWIKSQTGIKAKGEWIIFPKFFSTRLIELRQPTLAELDKIAPFHPVFLDGSYGGMINTAAMRQSGITTKTDHPGILRDKKTGLPTGLIRASAFNLLKRPARKELTYQDVNDALQSMFKRYNRYGITSIFSGSGSSETVDRYREMHENNKLTVRILQNIGLQTTRDNITKEGVLEKLKTLPFVTGDGDEWVRIGPLKIILDGGILTGTAFMREPWGDKAREIFGIEDPAYKGVLNYTREEVAAIVKAANELNWSFTAHSTGGGGVDLLLDVYQEVNLIKPIKERRFSIIHGNFFTEEAIVKMKELGVYANVQPAWFYKDADAMEYILGKERIKTFHPNRSMIDAGVIINGGSDHMVKWDANTSINPYNPFLGMWTMITRTTERGSVILPSEAITREEALKIYTINNAFASFEESIKGSIEPGKLADMVVLTDDILTCPADRIKNIESVMTFVGGNIVYSSP